MPTGGPRPATGGRPEDDGGLEIGATAARGVGGASSSSLSAAPPRTGSGWRRRAAARPRALAAARCLLRRATGRRRRPAQLVMHRQLPQVTVSLRASASWPCPARLRRAAAAAGLACGPGGDAEAGQTLVCQRRPRGEAADARSRCFCIHRHPRRHAGPETRTRAGHQQACCGGRRRRQKIPQRAGQPSDNVSCSSRPSFSSSGQGAEEVCAMAGV